MTYGSDFAGVEDVDFNLTFLEGETEERLSYTQAIARRYITPRGGLFYSLIYGLDIRQFLADALPKEIAAGVIAAEARKDERTLRSSCTIEESIPTRPEEPRTWTVSLQVEGNEGGTFILTFLANATSVELLKVDAV